MLIEAPRHRQCHTAIQRSPVFDHFVRYLIPYHEPAPCSFVNYQMPFTFHMITKLCGCPWPPKRRARQTEQSQLSDIPIHS